MIRRAYFILAIGIGSVLLLGVNLIIACDWGCAFYDGYREGTGPGYVWIEFEHPCAGEWLVRKLYLAVSRWSTLLGKGKVLGQWHGTVCS